MSHVRIAFLSSYPPRRCGIATFTSDLIENVSNASNGQVAPLVLAMTNSEKLCYTEPVEFDIRYDNKNDYILAADYLEEIGAELVCLQHEFGLFGCPSTAGEYLDFFLDRLNVPLVTTLHTILLEPSDQQYRMIRRLANLSKKTVVMSKYGCQILRQVYGIPQERITIIPHGIPDLPFSRTLPFKRMAGLEERTTILTFGLLGPNKGIEVMLKSMTQIVKDIPDALYIVLGATHPNVLKKEGESYRWQLEQMVKDLELQNNVTFVNEFVDDGELYRFLQMADFYVTPYLSEKQISSGTLAFALGTGRVVVSTPYWCAKELLADGCGRLVPFNDPEAIAKTILHLKQNPEEYRAIRSRAYTRGRDMTWSSAGRAYWGLFRDTVFDKKEAAILSEDSYMSQKTFGKQPATTSSYMYSYEKSLSKKTGNLAQVK
ncbi:MAG: hypothetical protein DRP65_01515 [Planctomycetota bacterium]|nr:MAG: hypothetical protein DRP65_01515 [Planctomycetota bacterium]